MFIHGEWHAGSGAGEVEITNPSTGKVFASVPEADQADLDRAIDSAREGLEAWRNTQPRVRAQVLNRMAERIKERDQHFARIEADDTGASIGSGLWTIHDVVARRLEYYAGMADKIRGDTFVTPGQFLSYSMREPVGVTGHVIPWNGPLWIGSRSIAPALAAGNAVVVKPSSEAPLSLLEFAALAFECGLPPGVLNVVTGRGSSTGNAFVAHPGLDGIYFTGSTATGRRVTEAAAGRSVRTVMELGGKSPNIVMADADIEQALQGAAFAIFANAGQICVAGSRLLVQAPIHEQFVARLAEMASAIRLGGPDTEADMGPVITASQRDAVLAHIAAGRGEASLVTGGGTPQDDALEGGFFVEPTIFDDVPPDASIAREEIFGPVLAVTPFEDLDEAVAIANDTPFGLAAAVWTTDLLTAHRCAERLQAGQVFVNHYYTAAFEMSRTPYKASGHGVSEGPDAIWEYLQQKLVSIKTGESGGW